MTLEQQIYDALIADAGINGVIGQRLYLVQLPQNPTYPVAAYQRISTQRIYSHSPQAAQASTGWSRFQFTCWASGATGGQVALAFRLALQNALQTFNAWALPTSPEVFLQYPNFILDERMGVEPQTNPPLFKAIIDAKIWFQDQ